MTQQNIQPISEILAAHAAGQEQLEKTKLHRQDGFDSLGNPPSLRQTALAEIQFQLDALPVPARDEAIAGAIEEIRALAVEFLELKTEFLGALIGEMEALKTAKIAGVVANYSTSWPGLELDPKATAQALHQAQENFDRAEYQRKVIAQRRQDIVNFIEGEYRGARLDGPSTWPGAAARRVDCLLGGSYAATEIASIKERTGLTDKMLSFLTKV